MIFAFKLAFVVYLVSTVILIIAIARKKFRPGVVPASVYERAVCWYQEIQELPTPERIVELNRWEKFINDIPRRKERVRVMPRKK